ncbi:MAG: hypothetical protein ACR2NY_01045 [Alphaproteobacteria bacterium]
MFDDLSLYGIFKEYRALWFVILTLLIVFSLSAYLWKKMGPFNTSRGKVVWSLLAMGLIIFVPLVLILNSIFTASPATFFILDQTDGFSVSDANRIEKKVLDEIDKTKGDSDLYFYEISKFNGQINAVSSYNIPLRKKVMSILDSVPEAEEKIHQKKYEVFRDGVETSLKKLLGNFVSPSSYILEGLSSLANKELPLADDKSRHLILISDLLQNSSAADFYLSDVPNAKIFLNSDNGKQFNNDNFKGLKVTIYMVSRPFYKKNPVKKILAKNFWRDYFFTRGAYKVTILDVDS